MATVKNFGLEGVASEVQLGKAGPSFKADAGKVEVRDVAGTLTNVKIANAVAADDAVTLAQLEAVQEGQASDGFAIVLGNVAVDGDGSWSPGAVPLTNETKVSDAVDQLNEILAKLVPSAPTNFPAATSMAVTSVGQQPRLASGSVPDNTSGGHGLSASSTVIRTAAATVSGSNSWNDVGPGETGTVQLLLNDTVIGSRALTGSGDAGTYSGLVISDQKDFPVSTPGFWKSIDIAVTNAAVATSGINKIELYHTGASAGTNEVFFVRDTLTSGSTISSASIAENVQGTLSYSSSVPHYGSGGSLTANLSINNLAGETYYGGSDPLTVSGTSSIIGSQNFTYANLGISTPIARNTTSATAVTPVTINLNGSNVFAVGTIQGLVRNVVNNSTAANLSSTNVLVMAGTQTGRVYELSVPVTGLGSIPNSNNAIRVANGAGDKPTAATSAWTASDALQIYDAAVVAGVLAHNQTNYSTGYLPVGPNLSVGRAGAQYVTFSFNRASVSKFKMTIAGSYAGVWIKLPGVSDNAAIASEAANNHGGWWNGYALYDGAGVPGEAGDPNAGCALGAIATGASGTFEFTFGTQSSTNATGNQILVRIRLNAGQSITALSFQNS